MARYESAAEAEAAFYEAFGKADIDMMLDLWDDAEDIVCVHPLGGSIQGTRSVYESWRLVLQQGPLLRFTPRIIHCYGDETTSVHHLYEHISHGHNFEKQSVVLCTNAYRLTDDGWRMVLHHGSPGSSQQSKAGPKPGGTVH